MSQQFARAERAYFNPKTPDYQEAQCQEAKCGKIFETEFHTGEGATYVADTCPDCGERVVYLIAGRVEYGRD